LFGLLGELVLCLVLGWVILGLDVTNLALFLNLVLVGLCMLLRSWASDGYFLLKLLHHVFTVILRRLHFALLLQHIQGSLKLFNLLLEFIILFSNEVITRFYKYMLNARLACLRETIISARQINLNL
jgi:hypothetical protein